MSATHGPADPADALAAAVSEHAAQPRRILVAFSGGPDSTLLLACATERWPRRRVVAVHVHHGWHASADDWAEHCRRRARALGTRCEVARVDAAPRAGEGPEAAARTARYAALAERLAAGDVLLTAHHRDDQAETLLLALLRGGGVHGWAGMPRARALGAGVHLRPWLDLDRAVLQRALAARGLDALDDPANRDTRHERAWLRGQVLPLLRERLPEVDATLARAADRAADAARAVDALAARDYVACRGARTDTLDAAALLRLPPERQRALVRWWCMRRGLPRPPAARLATLLEQIAVAGPDRRPHVEWPGGEARAWGGLVWAMAPLPAVEPGRVYRWTDRSAPLDLPTGRLPPDALARAGIEPAPGQAVEVRYPRGGERLRPPGAVRAEPLRELQRRAGIPPWQRDRTPLVYVDGELAAAIGVGPHTG